MELLLAEELLLVALDDRKGRSWNSNLHAGLAGAVLTDLARDGAVVLEGKKLQAAAEPSAGHRLLVRAHGVLAGSPKPRTPKAWVQRLPRALRPFTGAVAAGLVDRRVLSEVRHKVLGLFPVTTYPQSDPAPERLLRARLRAVLAGQRRPEDRDALLLGLLVPLQLVGGLVDRPDRRAARARAKQIAESGIAGDAVSSVVQEVQSAAAVAVVAAAAGASAGGGS